MTSQTNDSGIQTTPLPWRALVVILCGFAGAWISAGSVGLLAHPLRRVLTYILFGAIVLSFPVSYRRISDITWRTLGIGLAVWMTASAFHPVNVLAVAVLLACCGIGHSAPRHVRQTVVLASSSVAVFGIYRLALVSIPSVWIAADRIGNLLGYMAGGVTGKPLRIGATFSGIDFLVLILAFFGGWLVYSRPFRLRRIMYGILLIAAGHAAYLVILSMGTSGIHALPEGQPAGMLMKYPGILTMWHFPQLAGCIHLVVAGVMIRRLPWPEGADSLRVPGMGPHRAAILLTVAGLLLAAMLACLTMLHSPVGGLRGKKVVLYEQGFLNWLKPRHGEYGRLSIGMYGMLPAHIEALGGQCVISSELPASDLEDASLLVVIYPNDPWPEGMLTRIRRFVEEGGSLLVMGEHTVREADGGSRINDLLAPTNMRVRFDSATFAVGGWLHSYQSLSHPAFIGVHDDRNQFGAVIGASVESGWPARPLLIGRWGWADPGDEAGSAMMGNHRYDAGEKLGDIVLAAEQRLGTGRVIVFGDTSGITNGIMTDSHPFVYRLFGYLANERRDYQPAWRLVGALLVAAALSILFLMYLPGPGRVACVTALVVGLLLCSRHSAKAPDLLPDGRLGQTNNLAYIDSTHLSASSEEAWREEGTMGLSLTLMRNGYLALSLPEFTPEHLKRAGLLMMIAPRRPLSKRERRMAHDFVDQGGVLICMAGYEDAGPVSPLLADLGFRIGLPASVPSGTSPEPQPLGHFKSPYLRTGTQYRYVRFHAAWPVTCSDPQANVIAYGRGEVPVIMMRSIGQGKAVVIGDTCFAMNKNLEHQDGSPFEGTRENALFWRWFITLLRDEPMWIPPDEGAVRERAP